jgi:perosamine synthetase
MIQIADTKLTKEEIKAAVAVLESGALRQGKMCAKFEKKFAEKVGSKFALTCSSGTAALHLAYLACLQPGDEVLVPAFTFVATASMVTMTGGIPVFCDVTPDEWVIDVQDAEARITERTKAIAPVHLFGNSCQVEAIEELVAKYRLKVIWDAVQAHGTTYGEADVGSFDDLVCYSFYPSKNMFTGEGGMVTTNNPELAEKINFMRTHGQTDKYYHTMLGFNYRMTDVEAAIGLKQLERVDKMLAVRRRNGEIYTEMLSRVEGIVPQLATSGCQHSFHQFCILVDPDKFGMDRNELSEKLKERNIATGIHYPRGLNRQPIFEQLYGYAELPATDFICERILAVPVHHGLREDQCRKVASCIAELKR